MAETWCPYEAHRPPPRWFRKICARNSGKCGHFFLVLDEGFVKRVMLRSDRWSVEREQATPVEDPVDDSGAEVLVMKNAAPGLRRLVRGEDHRALLEVARVDDVEEHVRGVGPVGEVADLVANEDVGSRVERYCIAHSPFAARA